MRTPDSESEGAETEGAETSSPSSSNALADGFGGAGDSGSDGSESAFGSGWPSADTSQDDPFGSDGTSYLQQQEDEDQASEFESFEPDAGSELSAFEFESDYVPDTDTDWDVTGDGVVDHHDFHEATTGFHDFQVDPDDSHGHAQNEGFFHGE